LAVSAEDAPAAAEPDGTGDIHMIGFLFQVMKEACYFVYYLVL
jgi:hypothetical protein